MHLTFQVIFNKNFSQKSVEIKPLLRITYHLTFLCAHYTNDYVNQVRSSVYAIIFSRINVRVNFLSYSMNKVVMNIKFFAFSHIMIYSVIFNGVVCYILNQFTHEIQIIHTYLPYLCLNKISCVTECYYIISLIFIYRKT